MLTMNVNKVLDLTSSMTQQIGYRLGKPDTGLCQAAFTVQTSGRRSNVISNFHSGLKSFLSLEYIEVHDGFYTIWMY